MVHRFAASKTLGTLFSVVFLAAVFFFPSTALSENRVGDFKGTLDINATLGMELLDPHDWEPIHTPLYYGIDLGYEGRFWPAGLCGSLYYSAASDKTDSGDSVDGSITKLYLGIRKRVGLPSRIFDPYLQGGIAGATATIDHEELGEDTSSGYGYWFGGGSYVRLGGVFHAGLDLRYTFGSAKLLGSYRNIGGLGAGAVIGMEFGGR
ncbi:hypothetical protein EPN96_01765 [bacterium]|nr:MAG: hypothetical protein EPN96_01765 [bacterium]